MQANDEAERQKIAAQSAADVSRIQAQAAAEAKRVEGQGVAEYQKAIQPTLTPQVLRWREIEATKALADSPNTKLVLGGGSARGEASTVLDLRESGNENSYVATAAKGTGQ